MSQPKPKLDWKTLKMTRQFCREKQSENGNSLGKIQHCAVMTLETRRLKINFIIYRFKVKIEQLVNRLSNSVGKKKTFLASLSILYSFPSALRTSSIEQIFLKLFFSLIPKSFYFFYFPYYFLFWAPFSWMRSTRDSEKGFHTSTHCSKILKKWTLFSNVRA